MEPHLIKQLLSDANKGHINKDDLLEICLRELDKSGTLMQLAIDEGFIGEPELETDESRLERDISGLDTTQKIIERVLNRYGD